MLFQKWHTLNRKLSVAGIVLWVFTLAACGVRPDSGEASYRHSSYNADALAKDGLAVGFVVKSHGSAALKAYERSNHAYDIARNILAANPRLRGNLSGYRYVSQRVGKNFKSFIDRYRLEGDLSRSALNDLKRAQLQRRFLLLATLAPLDEIIELPPEVEPIVGSSNPQTGDYERVRLQTMRLNAVKVQVYDTWRGRKVLEQIVRSDDKNRMFATERSGVRYKGNSLMGALANSVSNRIAHTSDIRHPPPPNKRDALNFLWRRIAQSVPGSLTS